MSFLRPRKHKFSLEQFEAALRSGAGLYTHAARQLGCDRSTVAKAVERSKALREIVASLREEVGDMAESTIIRAIGEYDSSHKDARKNALNAAQFMMRRVGRVTDRTQLLAGNGEPIAPTIRFYMPAERPIPPPRREDVDMGEEEADEDDAPSARG